MAHRHISQKCKIYIVSCYEKLAAIMAGDNFETGSGLNFFSTGLNEKDDVYNNKHFTYNFFNDHRLEVCGNK